jgi:hypothetical protein
MLHVHDVVHVIYNKGGGVRERSGSKVNKKRKKQTEHKHNLTRLEAGHRSVIPSRDEASSNSEDLCFFV